MVGTKGNQVENLVKEVPEFVSLSNDNRTLTFHPFSSSEYSSEIHASTYKCIAKNKAGIIASPEIDLKAGTFFYRNYKPSMTIFTATRIFSLMLI